MLLDSQVSPIWIQMGYTIIQRRDSQVSSKVYTAEVIQLGNQRPFAIRLPIIRTRSALSSSVIIPSGSSSFM